MTWRVARRRLWVRALSRVRVDVPVVLIDVMLVAGSFVLGFDGHVPSSYSERMYELLPVVVAAYVASNLAWGSTARSGGTPAWPRRGAWCARGSPPAS